MNHALFLVFLRKTHASLEIEIFTCEKNVKKRDRHTCQSCSTESKTNRAPSAMVMNQTSDYTHDCTSVLGRIFPVFWYSEKSYSKVPKNSGRVLQSYSIKPRYWGRVVRSYLYLSNTWVEVRDRTNTTFGRVNTWIFTLPETPLQDCY